MDQILKGGADMILGGGETLSIVTAVIGCIIGVVLIFYMKHNPPSSIFGNIAFILGAIIVLVVTLVVVLKGTKLLFR